jgi:small GTP-binding protein
MLLLLLLLFWSKKGEVTEDVPAPPIVKAIFVGDSGVGKTAIITRFTRDEFEEDPQSTIGTDFRLKEAETSRGTTALLLWDTADQPVTYRSSDVAYIVFDITSQSSFNSLATWMDAVREINPDVPFILIGNKADLAGERVVSYEEAEEFAKKNNMEYFETSAKTGDDITEAITSCLELVIDKRALPPPSPEPAPEPSGGGRG